MTEPTYQPPLSGCAQRTNFGLRRRHGHQPAKLEPDRRADFGGERTNGCNDYLVLTYPQAVEKVHRSFLEVGVDVIETCTFRANRLTLGEYGLDDRRDDINQAAAAPGPPAGG